MFVPYEPYIDCMDGAVDELDRVLALCTKHGIRVLIDIHAMKGSQNGLDNSGTTGNYEWVSTVSTGGAARYKHWEIRGGNWIGHWNQEKFQYDDINQENIDHSLRVVKIVVDMYKNNPIVVGLEPINEPWGPIPMEILQEFYWRSHLLIREGAPHWITLFHDSFRLNYDIWADFMSECENCALGKKLGLNLRSV